MADKIEKYEGKEDDFQQSIARYISCEYPEVLWCHIPNGGKRNEKEGAKFKRMGVRAGMPDVMIFKARVYEPHNIISNIGLAIELKVKKGKVTESQQKCMDALKKAGWQVEVCWNFDQAQEIIDEYLK